MIRGKTFDAIALLLVLTIMSLVITLFGVSPVRIY